MGEVGSLHRGEKAIHNGDDNASGVAVMLHLATVLQAKSARKQQLSFIAFSGEEEGLLGSNYFTKSNH